MVSKLTPLRPSRNRADERPPRRSPRPRPVIPKGRVFLAGLTLLASVYAGAAQGANPPDPLTKAYGKPSATYMRQRGSYVWVCQLWAYRRGRIPAETIERCVVYGLAHPNKPKPAGPAS